MPVLFAQLTQVLDPEPHAAPMNMALDEALLAQATEPQLRIYRWASPAVSFGYFGNYAPIAIAWPGREIVRRMTGGGIVAHGDDITYSLSMPEAHPVARLSARESYRVIHAALAAWLAGRGFAATLAAGRRERVGGACFENPAEADVLDGSRKLAGAAQRRTRQGLLYQGSIQGVPCEWRDELPQAFAGKVAVRDFSAVESRLAVDFASVKYGSPEWLRRIP
jgi:lipoyl(octanoyl) transferase